MIDDLWFDSDKGLQDDYYLTHEFTVNSISLPFMQRRIEHTGRTYQNGVIVTANEPSEYTVTIELTDLEEDEHKRYEHRQRLIDYFYKQNKGSIMRMYLSNEYKLYDAYSGGTQTLQMYRRCYASGGDEIVRYVGGDSLTLEVLCTDPYLYAEVSGTVEETSRGVWEVRKLGSAGTFPYAVIYAEPDENGLICFEYAYPRGETKRFCFHADKSALPQGMALEYRVNTLTRKVLCEDTGDEALPTIESDWFSLSPETANSMTITVDYDAGYVRSARLGTYERWFS